MCPMCPILSFNRENKEIDGTPGGTHGTRGNSAGVGMIMGHDATRDGKRLVSGNEPPSGVTV